MATKKVLQKHLVEVVDTTYKSGKGYPLNRQPIRPMQNVVPVEDLGQGSSGSGANLAYTVGSTQGVVTSDTGTDAIVPSVTNTNAGLMLPSHKVKLDSLTTTQIGTSNGATFRYYALTGTPVVTYDTSVADQPVLHVTGGTIRLVELWVPYNGASGVNPIWTINGTVSADRFISTPIITKVIENTTTPSIAGTYNQKDVDNTPQIRYGDYTATSVKVQLASVTGTWNFGFLFTMNQ